MKSLREILQTETFWTTKIQTELYDAVEQFLAQNNLTRQEFAKKLGVSKGYVTQVLKGDFNHRVSKLVQLALAIGKVPVLHFVDIEKYLKEQEKKVKQHKIQLDKPQVQTYANAGGESDISNTFQLNTEKMAVSRLKPLAHQGANRWKIIYNAKQEPTTDQLRTYEGA